MRRYTMDEIRGLCLGATVPLGDPFVDRRLAEYQTLYGGAHRYYAALRDIAKALQPAICLEVGTWQGTSAACLAAGNPDGLVLTIDHHSDPGDEFNWDRTLEAQAACPAIRYLQGSSTAAVQRLKPQTDNVAGKVHEILDGRKIDLFFIDGWHRGDLAREDWDTYESHLAPGALVICDDLLPDDSDTISGMMAFWNGLPLLDKHIDPYIHPGYPMGFGKTL